MQKIIEIFDNIKIMGYNIKNLITKYIIMNNLKYIKNISELSSLLAGRKPPYRSNMTINILTLYKKVSKISWKDFKEDFEFCKRIFENKTHDEYIHWLLELIIEETSEDDLVRILIDIYTIEKINKLEDFFYINNLSSLENKWDILKDFSNEVWKKIKDCWIDFWQLSRLFVDIWYSRTTVEKITQCISDKEDVTILLFDLLKEYRHLWDKLHKYLYLLANKFDTYNYSLSSLVRALIGSKLENDEVRKFKNLVRNDLKLDFNQLKNIILSIEDYKYYKTDLDKMNDLYDLFSSNLIVSENSKTLMVRKINTVLDKLVVNNKDINKIKKNKTIDLDSIINKIEAKWVTIKELSFELRNLGYIDLNQVITCRKDNIKNFLTDVLEYIDEKQIVDEIMEKIISKFNLTNNTVQKENKTIDIKKISLYLAWKLPPNYIEPNLLRFIRVVNNLFPEYYNQTTLETFYKQSNNIIDKFFFMILDDIYSEIWFSEKFEKLLKDLYVKKDLYIEELNIYKDYNKDIQKIEKDLQWISLDIWTFIISKTIHKYKIFSENTLNIQSELWNYYCNECEKNDFKKFFKKIFDKLEKIDYNISDFISILEKEIKLLKKNTLILNNNSMNNLQNVSGEIISQRLQEKWGSVTLLKKDTKQIKNFLSKVENKFGVSDLKWIKFVSYTLPEDDGNLWLTVVLNVESLTKSFTANWLSLEDVLNAKNYIKDRLSSDFENYSYTDLIEWKDEEAVLYKIASEVEWLILESDISSKFNENDSVTYETSSKKYYGKVTARIFNKSTKNFEYSTTFSPALWDYSIVEEMLKMS